MNPIKPLDPDIMLMYADVVMLSWLVTSLGSMWYNQVVPSPGGRLGLDFKETLW